MPVDGVGSVVTTAAAALAAIGYAVDGRWLPVTSWRWVPLWVAGLAVVAVPALDQPWGWRRFAGIAVSLCMLVGLGRRLVGLSRRAAGVGRTPVEPVCPPPDLEQRRP